MLKLAPFSYHGRYSVVAAWVVLLVAISFVTSAAGGVFKLALVPATIDLLGDRNWWLLRWLDRVLPDVLERDDPTGSPSSASSARAACSTSPSSSSTGPRTIPTASAPLTRCRWPAGLHVLNEGTASPSLRTNPPTEQTEALAWLAWRAAWEDRLDDLEADRDRRPSPQLIWRWRTTR
jgi:hypothetical protein